MHHLHEVPASPLSTAKEASVPSSSSHEAKEEPVSTPPEKHVLSPSGQEVPASLSALIGFEAPVEEPY